MKLFCKLLSCILLCGVFVVLLENDGVLYAEYQANTKIQVLDKSRHPISNVEITYFDHNSNVTQTCFTDSNGVVEPLLKQGQYSFTLKKEGYRSLLDDNIVVGDVPYQKSIVLESNEIEEKLQSKKKLPDAAFLEQKDLQGNIKSWMKKAMQRDQNISYDALQSGVIKRLNTYDDVHIEQISAQGILKITQKSGLITYVDFTGESGNRGSAGVADDTENSMMQENKVHYIDSKNALLWNPFDSQWGSADETEVVKDIFDNVTYPYQLDIVKNNNADIKSLTKIANYGIIIIASHGFDNWMLTGEIAASAVEYKEEQSQGEISICIKPNIVNQTANAYYMVNSQWFTSHLTEKLPNSLIIQNVCGSAGFADTYLSMGAGAYFGYTGTVTNEQVVNYTAKILNQIVLDGGTVSESFQLIESTEQDVSKLILRGFAHLKMKTSLANRGFEYGLAGWEHEGQVKIMPKFDEIVAADGNQMCVLSNPYSGKLTAVSQRMHVPEMATKLSLQYTVESQKERSNQVARVYLYDEKGTKHELSAITNSVSGDWRILSLPIVDFQGTNVTIEIQLEQNTDAVVCVDNLLFDLHNDIIVNGELVTIQRKAKAAAKKNTTGISHIFYDKNYFKTQANKKRKTLQSLYSYRSISQVVMHSEGSLSSFKKAWNKLKRGKGNKIDTIVMMYHGSYYTIAIDYKKYDYLTSTPNGYSKSKNNGLYIGAMKRYSIKRIELFTCNNGLLEALDTQVPLRYKNKTKFYTKGNVAEAFLSRQNVQNVQAFDGSLSYVKGTAVQRKANTQTRFYDFLKEVKKYKKYSIYRNNYATLGKNGFKYDKEPKGTVYYYRKNNKMYAQYWRKVIRKWSAEPERVNVTLQIGKYKKKT